MINKYLFPQALLTVSLLYLMSASSASAAPLVSIGDNTDVFFNGSSSLRWSSNIFRDEDEEESDLSWTVSPGFEINVGRGVSNADLSIITRYDVISYQDNDQMDTELFHIKAVGSYKTSRLNLKGSVSFDENKLSSGENNVTNDLVEYDTSAGNLDAEYRVSPKFSFGAGFRYQDKEYQTFGDRFADREKTSFPLDVFYELTPKLDLSLGYTYATTDTEGTSSSSLSGPQEITQVVLSDYEMESHFFNVGLRGYILPKLTGFFKIGYRTRNSDDSTIFSTPTDISNPIPVIGATTTSSTNRKDSGTLGLDADLTWTATPKLTVRLDLSRDFGVGGEGQSTENTSADLIGIYSINNYFSASANLGYTIRDYTNTGREDDQLNGGLRLSYSLNQHWRFSTGYTYSENDSNEANRSYEDHMVDLTAVLRY